MEAVSALAVIVGLVGSLDTTLRTLHHLTYDFTSELRNLDRDLIQIQTSLHVHAQVQELLDVLQVIEKTLDDLQENIESVEKTRKIRLLRRSSPRRDYEAAAASILLAKDMIHIIRTVRVRSHGEKVPMNSVRSHNQASLQILSAMKRDFNQPLLHAPSTKAQELFAWIAGPEGEDKIHERCRAERIAGTCEWFLERKEFESWLQRPSGPGDEVIFWCVGRPGIRKTMLASKVIDQLRPVHAVPYFYMSSGKLHSASDVVTSLLRQLCLPFHIVPKRLQEIFQKTNGEPGHKLGLEDLLEALREVSRSISQPVIMIIDGLDETNIREQGDFVQVFDSLKNTNWKCLVTSRDTRRFLPKGYDQFSRFIIEDDANKEDIGSFVESVLKGHEPVDTMLKKDPNLRSDLIRTLTLQAHGMFYWATLQVRLILDQTQLSGIRETLKSIPNNIHDIVDIALKIIKLQDDKRAELAISALALLTAAQKPLTAEAMCHALGLAPVLDCDPKNRPSKLNLEEIPNPESMIDCCMGLVKMDPTIKVVTLAHYDILQEMQKEWAELFSPRHTAKLAKTCIAYLSLDIFSGGPCHDLSALETRIEEHPFLDYASHYWGYHVRAALLLETCEAEIMDDIQRLLKQPMNLALSLQVSEYDPESKERTRAMDIEQFLGLSELQMAIRHGLEKIVHRILKASPDMISARDKWGRTALHDAAQAGWEGIVTMLIDFGGDPYQMDYEGKTPFIYAAERGYACITSLLQTYFVHNDQSQKALEQALFDAIEADKASVVEELLTLKACPDAEKIGSSAMTLACRRGNKRIVHLLSEWLESGARISSLDSLSSFVRLPSDDIPLHQAIRNDHVDVASFLLDHGADIDFRDDNGRTALFETLDASDVRGAALLLKRGTDISCRDSGGDTVLHEAARRGAVEHASRFVERGITTDLPNHEGLTPLHLAARHGHLELANLLLRKGADIDQADLRGRTPLMYAASAGNEKLCEMLCDLGASVNTDASSHADPIILAGETGDHQEKGRLLILD